MFKVKKSATKSSDKLIDLIRNQTQTEKKRRATQWTIKKAGRQPYEIKQGQMQI